MKISSKVISSLIAAPIVLVSFGVFAGGSYPTGAPHAKHRDDSASTEIEISSRTTSNILYKFDFNKDGFIDLTEYSQMTKDINEARDTLREKRMYSVFNDIDSNNDGSVSYEEFKNYKPSKPHHYTQNKKQEIMEKSKDDISNLKKDNEFGQETHSDGLSPSERSNKHKTNGIVHDNKVKPLSDSEYFMQLDTNNDQLIDENEISGLKPGMIFK